MSSSLAIWTVTTRQSPSANFLQDRRGAPSSKHQLKRADQAPIPAESLCTLTDSAKAQWRQVADQLRPKVPKQAVLMDEAERDVLAYMSFPREHRQKLHSTNPIERLHAEVKRRTNVVGIFPNEAAITRLVGAILLEQNDEWAVSRRYMTLESIAPLSDGVPITLPTVAA